MKWNTLLVTGLLITLSTNLIAQDQKKKTDDEKNPAAESPKTPSTNPYKTISERGSYGIGRDIGERLKSSGLELDAKALVQGLTDVFAGTKSPQTNEEFHEAITALEKQAEGEAVAKAAAAAAKAQAFLDDNAKQKEVTTTKSGLQYQVLKAGTGKSPTATDTVRAHYKGTFLDGKTFDSSYDRGEPAIFPLNRVIKGWTEGVPLMKVGAKYKFWIPSDLAYGPGGKGSIPPNSVLVFEVELLEVMKDGADDAPVAPKKK